MLTPTTRNLIENIDNTKISYTDLAKKLIEESAEVLEQASVLDAWGYNYYDEDYNFDALVMETLDVLQMCLNILNYEHQTIIENCIEEHNKKLNDRGWERDTSLKLEIKRGE